MENPYIPKKKVKKVIISHETDSSLLKILEKLNIKPIKTPKVYDFPIASHPDILFHLVDEKTAVIDKNWDLKLSNTNLIKTKKDLEEQYPKDCRLNIGRLGDYYLTKEKVIDENLEEELKKRRLKHGKTNQAYTKCSLLYLTKKSFITQDKGIYKIGKKLGFRAYLVPSGGVYLPPYDTGFIGGTGGLVDDKKILFYGDPSNYKYEDRLVEILEKEKITFLHGKGPFRDLGSIIGIGE